jgi:hypothetical protein
MDTPAMWSDRVDVAASCNPEDTRGETMSMSAPMPRKAVTKERRGTSHGLHLVLTICTAGTWGLFVWLPLTLWHKFGPRRKTVTRYR